MTDVSVEQQLNEPLTTTLGISKGGRKFLSKHLKNKKDIKEFIYSVECLLSMYEVDPGVNNTLVVGEGLNDCFIKDVSNSFMLFKYASDNNCVKELIKEFFDNNYTQLFGLIFGGVNKSCFEFTLHDQSIKLHYFTVFPLSNDYGWVSISFKDKSSNADVSISIPFKKNK